jgi:hypothetical protein
MSPNVNWRQEAIAQVLKFPLRHSATRPVRPSPSLSACPLSSFAQPFVRPAGGESNPPEGRNGDALRPDTSRTSRRAERVKSALLRGTGATRRPPLTRGQGVGGETVRVWVSERRSSMARSHLLTRSSTVIQTTNVKCCAERSVLPSSGRLRLRRSFSPCGPFRLPVLSCLGLDPTFVSPGATWRRRTEIGSLSALCANVRLRNRVAEA